MAAKGKKTTRKLTAILCADVVGYSRLMGADEEATIETLTTYRKVFTSEIKKHRGRVVDAKGDAILAEFASVVDAVNGAVEIQRELAEKNTELPDERRMDFRIGINLGDVVVKDDVIYGDGVNVAARLEALAKPGGICISRPVFDQVESKLKLEYEYLGEQQVKNIAKPVRAYSVKLTQSVDQPEQREPVSAASLVPDGISLELPDKPSIAVLSFENMSGDKEQEYFSDGITEDIITDLSKLSELFVIARNASFTYKGKAVLPQQVGQELGVRYVLEGSVRKAGNRVRITAQLVDAQSGHHLWAERYDRELEDLFAVQDEITLEIVTALNVTLISGEQARIWQKALKNPEARDFMYRGNMNLNQAKRETAIVARRMFERVIELEPDSAPGYNGAAWSHYQDAAFGTGEFSLPSMQKAAELARKALSFDKHLAPSHSMLAFFHLYQGEHEQALAEAWRATELAPNAAHVNNWMAFILGYCSRAEEALVWARRALRLSPICPIFYLSSLGHAYLLCGRHEEAIAAYKGALARDSEFVRALTGLARTYMRAGREEEARAEARKILEINPRFSLQDYEGRLPYKDPALRDAAIADLRQAGLPD